MATCTKCGKEGAEIQGLCESCRTSDVRARMKSMSNVLDTNSFMIPAQRNIVWVWTTVTLGVLLVGETIYFLFLH